MKQSNYNEYFVVYGCYFVFNTINNKFIQISQENFDRLKNNQLELLDKKTLSRLVDLGIIIDKNVDELNIIKQIFTDDKINKNLLDITIIITLNCNFQCSYCYEDKQNKQLSREDMLSILDFIESKISLGYEELLITWYGGEPLLMFDLIYEFNQKIIKICKNNKVKYSAYITTNGYLLNKEIVPKLKKMMLQNICITLDGTREYHDERRMLKNGNKTFDKIINNIKMLKVAKIPFIVRLNMDKDNINSLYEIKDYLDQHIGNNYYLGHVLEYSKQCNNEHGCLSTEEFANASYEISKNRQLLPKILNTHCRASRNSTFVIDCDLKVYVCGFGIDETIDSIELSKLNNTFNSENSFYNWDPFSYEKCVSCKAVRYCMGGCVLFGNKKGLPECTPIKFTYNKIIRDYLAKSIKGEIIKLKDSIKFRAEKEWVLICDCKNLFDFKVSLKHYELLERLQKSICVKSLLKEEKAVVKDLKVLGLIETIQEDKKTIRNEFK